MSHAQELQKLQVFSGASATTLWSFTGTEIRNLHKYAIRASKAFV
jgi:hypothetical protein